MNIVYKLITNGINIWHNTRFGQNLLHSPSVSLEVLSYILSLGLDINQQDENGRTPLIDAVISTDYEKIIFLIKNKADTTIKDDLGNIFLDYGPLFLGCEKTGEIRDLLTLKIPS